MNNNNCEQRSALPLFLVGLGAGIAVGLLMAPLSGNATRDLLTRKMKDGENWVKDQANGAEKYVRAQSADLRGRVNDVADVITRA